MTNEEASKKRCALSFASEELCNCIPEHCMAWKQVSKDEGYCKIIEGLDSIGRSEQGL